jgi:hypothetical protein
MELAIIGAGFFLILTLLMLLLHMFIYGSWP